MAKLLITVSGQAENKHEPQTATVFLSVEMEGPVRPTVVETANQLVARLREQLKELEARGSITDWSGERVHVRAERPWSSEGKVLPPIHYVSVPLKATFTDFGALGTWLGSVAETEGMSVSNVQWDLFPETRAKVEADTATEAVAVAFEKARVYAAAAGKSTVVPTAIADAGMLDGGNDHAVPQARAFSAVAANSSAGPIEMTPRDITVQVSVDAQFETE